jgi:hypothetical protein
VTSETTKLPRVPMDRIRSGFGLID